MNKYIVYGEDTMVSEYNDWSIVIANTKEEAKQKYIRTHISDESFLENTYDLTLNGGFIDRFVHDDKDDLLERYWNDKVNNEYLNKCITQNIKDYFEEYEDWMQIYLNYFNTQQEIQFPDDMLIYIYANSSWNPLEVLDVNELEIIE